MTNEQAKEFELKLKKSFSNLLCELPTRIEDGDVIFDSTEDVNMILHMNKMCIKILKEKYEL